MSSEVKIGARVQENPLVSAAKRYQEEHKYNIPVILHHLTWHIASFIGGLRSIVKVDTTKLEKHIDMSVKVSCTVEQLHALQKLFLEIDFTRSKAPKEIKDTALSMIPDILAEIDLFFSSTSIESDDKTEKLGETPFDFDSNNT